MTELDWDAATEPQEMLRLLKDSGRASDRNLRLFAVACCRRIWDVLTDEAARGAVEVAERFADEEATAEELELAADAVCDRHTELEEELDQAEVYPAETVRLFNALEAAWLATRDDFRFGIGGIWGNVDWARKKDGAEYPALCGLLRDIFGTPHRRPIAADPSWRTPAVVALAQAAYDERQLPSGYLDRARLLVLADALEEAGCDDAGLLQHLRGEGPHVRGCFAVDVVLGKS